MTITEIEAKFEIIQDEVKTVIETLTSLNSLGDFKLGSAKQVINLDTYFDTDQRDLEAIKGGLRTRLVNDTDYLVTLKLKKGVAAETDGTFKRIELEGEPTNDLLKQIWQTLASQKLHTAGFDDIDLLRVGVEGVFTSWGFLKLFAAKNQRTVRLIYDTNDNVVAELSIDNVIYSTGENSNPFTEIEIETKGDQSSEAILAQLSTDLKALFPTQITPSQLSKYARGLEAIL